MSINGKIKATGEYDGKAHAQGPVFVSTEWRKQWTATEARLLAVAEMGHGPGCYLLGLHNFIRGFIEARRLQPDRFILQYQQYYITNT